MTSGEFKFALQVERVLNMIPQPEYRQLMVEALMVTTFLVESDCRVNLERQVIHIDKLVHEANDIFIKDQVCGLSSVIFSFAISKKKGLANAFPPLASVVEKKTFVELPSLALFVVVCMQERQEFQGNFI